MEKGICLPPRVCVSPLRPLKVRAALDENLVLYPRLDNFLAALLIHSVPWTVLLQPSSRTAYTPEDWYMSTTGKGSNAGWVLRWAVG